MGDTTRGSSHGAHICGPNKTQYLLITLQTSDHYLTFKGLNVISKERGYHVSFAEYATAHFTALLILVCLFTVYFKLIIF